VATNYRPETPLGRPLDEIALAASHQLRREPAPLPRVCWKAHPGPRGRARRSAVRQRCFSPSNRVIWPPIGDMGRRRDPGFSCHWQFLSLNYK